MPENIQVTNAVFWWSALVLALADAVFVFFLLRWVTPERFRRLRWSLVGSAAFSWGLFGFLLVQVFWESYYVHFMRPWMRSGGILLTTLPLYGFFALAFHWMALRLPGHPLLSFCLLAGVESVFEHLWGIFGMKILVVPMLQGADPLPVVVLSFPEYIFYWCNILVLALLAEKAWTAMRLRRANRQR